MKNRIFIGLVLVSFITLIVFAHLSYQTYHLHIIEYQELYSISTIISSFFLALAFLFTIHFYYKEKISINETVSQNRYLLSFILFSINILLYFVMINIQVNHSDYLEFNAIFFSNPIFLILAVVILIKIPNKNFATKLYIGLLILIILNELFVIVLAVLWFMFGGIAHA